jgi:hypothetical protein
MGFFFTIQRDECFIFSTISAVKKFDDAEISSLLLTIALLWFLGSVFAGAQKSNASFFLGLQRWRNLTKFLPSSMDPTGSSAMTG